MRWAERAWRPSWKRRTSPAVLSVEVDVEGGGGGGESGGGGGDGGGGEGQGEGNTESSGLGDEALVPPREASEDVMVLRGDRAVFALPLPLPLLPPLPSPFP